MLLMILNCFYFIIIVVLLICEFIVKEIIVSDLIKRSTNRGLAIGEYLMWTVHNSLPIDFLNLIFQVKFQFQLFSFHFYIFKFIYNLYFVLKTINNFTIILYVNYLIY